MKEQKNISNWYVVKLISASKAEREINFELVEQRKRVKV